jgi:hypothetical protein
MFGSFRHRAEAYSRAIAVALGFPPQRIPLPYIARSLRQTAPKLRMSDFAYHLN